MVVLVFIAAQPEKSRKSYGSLGFKSLTLIALTYATYGAEWGTTLPPPPCMMPPTS